MLADLTPALYLILFIYTTVNVYFSEDNDFSIIMAIYMCPCFISLGIITWLIVSAFTLLHNIHQNIIWFQVVAAFMPPTIRQFFLLQTIPEIFNGHHIFVQAICCLICIPVFAISTITLLPILSTYYSADANNEWFILSIFYQLLLVIPLTVYQFFMMGTVLSLLVFYLCISYLYCCYVTILYHQPSKQVTKQVIIFVASCLLILGNFEDARFYIILLYWVINLVCLESNPLILIFISYCMTLPMVIFYHLQFKNPYLCMIGIGSIITSTWLLFGKPKLGTPFVTASIESIKVMRAREIHIGTHNLEKTTAYDIYIKTRGKQYKISKRYSELESMHNEMVIPFQAGLLLYHLPAFPPKFPKWWKDHSSTKFIEERRVLLDNYYRDLLRVHGIRNSNFVEGLLLTDAVSIESEESITNQTRLLDSDGINQVNHQYFD